MGIELAIQYVVCIRSYLHFGLWWMCFLSKSAWKDLETCWNVARRIALHEKCSQTLKIDKLEEITDLTSIQNFANYLMQLRSTKLVNSKKCERFTLNSAELAQLTDQYDPNKHSTSTVKRREQTTEATTQSVTRKRNTRMAQKYGNIKAYLFELGTSRQWDNKAFKHTKCELRIQYNIPRKKVPNEILNLAKHKLLEFLNSFSKARTHFQISTSTSLN